MGCSTASGSSSALESPPQDFPHGVLVDPMPENFPSLHLTDRNVMSVRRKEMRGTIDVDELHAELELILKFLQYCQSFLAEVAALARVESDLHRVHGSGGHRLLQGVSKNH
jgi:hypothetical protein